MRNISANNWLEIVAMWQSHRVPEIKIMTFDKDKHNPTTAWFSLTNNTPLNYLSNPINRTASHIIELEKREQPIKIAHKLMGFTLGLDSELIDDLRNIIYSPSLFRNEARCWWYCSSKYALPEPYSRYERNTCPRYAIPMITDMETLVKHAAHTWTAIAEAAAVIKHPSIHS
ncbi:hypothetical protein [Agarivorans sp. Z349TD_8]|uniref:hypothetical protein n=1 Tax=Agarivorans sp. Z349TD_8 TaxID=3421434 RepID=UPI003D7D3F99